MKRTSLFITCVLASLAMSAQAYFPEGTKWTEIRLDKLKYDSWYSKIGDEWVPNFETIEYEVRGEYISRSGEKFKCVYTDGPEWTDSLTLLLQEEGDAEYDKHNSVMVSVLVRDPYYGDNPFWPCIAYQFDWSIGESFYIYDIWMSDIDGGEYDPWFCGPINEIKEDFFGGTTPLKYVDVDIYKSVWKKYKKGVRIIQGIGITEWNDGECLFGPPNPYGALSSVFPEDYPKRHYRSKLVHFERNGEVLYNIWPDVSQESDYRPFVEDDKVWVVKVLSDSWPREEWIEFYYLQGDTIINGQTAKRMLCDRIGSWQATSGEYVGACYEQDKKVYFAYDGDQQQFKLLYDFSLSTGDTIPYSCVNIWEKVEVTKMSGGIPGFKGSYYNLNNVEHWLEGVGSEYWPWLNVCGFGGPRGVRGGNTGILLVCSVGDEIIYYNSEEDDSYIMGARKRFDFTHTVKTKPQARTRGEEGLSLYGEYNDVQLGINLDPLDDAYQVRITDETGKVIYEKAINAGNIVGLNIDISSYAKGRYTVTVENSQETFTGEFDAQATGIAEVRSITKEASSPIYNLQGQRLNTLQKGLNRADAQ